MTLGQRWTRRRNLALALVALEGASHRYLGDVFDIHPSRVCRILKELEGEFGPVGGLNRANILSAIKAPEKRSERDRLPEAHGTVGVA